MKRSAGFSLIELSIVLVILGLLAGGLLSGIAGQREVAARLAAQRQLEEARDLLLGFAMVYGRLPCPAAPTQSAPNASAGREDCTLEHGVLPWATLGTSELDPWGNRLSYYARSLFTAALPAGAQASFTLDTAGNAAIKDSASAGYDIASGLAAVVVSHGPSPAGAWSSDGGKISGASGDEAENADSDLTFVARTPTPDFDDQLTWIAPTLLKARLLAAGRLP